MKRTRIEEVFTHFALLGQRNSIARHKIAESPGKTCMARTRRGAPSIGAAILRGSRLSMKATGPQSTTAFQG